MNIQLPGRNLTSNPDKLFPSFRDGVLFLELCQANDVIVPDPCVIIIIDPFQALMKPPIPFTANKEVQTSLASRLENIHRFFYILADAGIQMEPPLGNARGLKL